MVPFTEMVKTQGAEALLEQGTCDFHLEGLKLRSLLVMQVEFFSTYPWKEERAEAKDAEKGRLARGETPGKCEVLEVGGESAPQCPVLDLTNGGF